MTDTKPNHRIPCKRCNKSHQTDQGKVDCHRRQLAENANLASFGDLPDEYQYEAAADLLAWAEKIKANASRVLARGIRKEMISAWTEQGPARSKDESEESKPEQNGQGEQLDFAAWCENSGPPDYTTMVQWLHESVKRKSWTR